MPGKVHGTAKRRHLDTGNATKDPTADPINSSDTNIYLSSWQTLCSAYSAKTSPLAKSLDTYLLCCFAVGLLQMAYCLSTRGRHYQSFLGGFIACVGSFVLVASVRLQVEGMVMTSPKNCLHRARLVVEFVLGHIALFMLVANFIS